MSTASSGAMLPKPVLRALTVGLLYFVGAAAAVRYTRFEGGAACMWVASAILIAELVQRRPRDWGWPLACATIGGMAATLWFGVGPIGAPLIAPFTTGEAALAAFLLRRCGGERPDLGMLRSVVVFIGAAGVIAPALSGLGGALVIAPLTGTPIGANWANWYVGHALGNITLTPIALLALSGEMFDGIAALHWRRKLEGAMLIAATAAVSALVFNQTRYPMLFLPLLPLTVAAFRFDRLGGALAIVILAVVGGGMTLVGNGPVHLISGSTSERALFLQFYLAVAVVMTLLISAELNQRNALVRALRDSEARYRLIADGSGDVILTLSVEGLIQYASPSIRELGQYDPLALHGRNAAELVVPEDRDAVARAHRAAIENPQSTVTVQYRGVTASGEMMWCETHTRGMTDEAGRVVGAVSAIRDISAHKSVEAELSRAAETDPLTGMVNRRAFEAALDRRLGDVTAGHGHGVCAVFDLDYFKQVNDRHGHAAGDRVLCAFADIARRSLRGSDLVARIGGEEFAAILWDTDIAEAHTVCERLRREVEDMAVAIDGADAVRFTFSGGLAPIAAGQSRAQTLREADQALYRAKRSGRNRLETVA